MMHYKPSLPKKNHNVSKEAPWRVIGKFFIFIFILMGLFLSLSYIILPFLPIQKEIALFGDLDIGIDFGPVNPKQTEYIQSIVDKVKETKENYRVEVVCNEEFNALATLGARIYIFSGLFESIESENELVFVIGHEISHIQNRDVLRNFISSVPLQIINALIFNGSIDASSLQNVPQMQFNKYFELRADEESLHFLNRTYGHVGGALKFFKHIQAQEYFSFLTAFSDHPLTQTREKRIKTLIENSGYKEKATFPLPKDILSGCQ